MSERIAMTGDSLIQHRDPLRERLAKACDEYLAQGGEIEQLDVARRKRDSTGSLKSRSSAEANIDKRNRHSLRKRDEALVTLRGRWLRWVAAQKKSDSDWEWGGFRLSSPGTTSVLTRTTSPARESLGSDKSC